MDFGTSSCTSANPERNDNPLSSSNPHDMMLVAQLQTRLAVVETELRHAEKERQETQVGTQMLLRLLASNNLAPSMAHKTEVDVSAAQSSIALQKQFHLVVKECERLRKKCRRLRVRNKIERTLGIIKFKQRLSVLGAVRTESFITDETSGSRDTLTTMNDDTAEEEPAFHYDEHDEPHDSVLDDNGYEYQTDLGAMLDDVDTSAPWYIAVQKDVEAKTDLTQHRHDYKASMRGTQDQACLNDPAESVSGQAKTLEDAQSDMQSCQPLATHQGKRWSRPIIKHV
jgi:hypothetical protein